ncbi:MAG: hypothetical protein RL346_1450 [Verrucomicrobiota bacterium]
MKARVVISIIRMAGCFLMGSAGWAQDEPTGAEKWIADLSADGFKVRENASLELWKLGLKAVPLLREAELSEDPEVAMRAGVALEKIELGISPDTSASILGLIDAYRTGPSGEKPGILRKLRDEKAYFQLLKLYSMEDANERKTLYPAVQNVAVTAAREAIVADDVDRAIHMLRLMSGSEAELTGLACLYRALGQLDQQLSALDPPQGVDPLKWKGVLLRAKGDLGGAIRHTAEVRDAQRLAALNVLAGNPVMWLESGNANRNQPNRSHSTYAELALKRWRGDGIDKSDIEPLLKLLRSNSRFSQMQAMNGLSALGMVEPVYEMQKKENPLGLYDVHLMREEHDKLLEALGIRPGETDAAKWAEQQFREILDGEYSDLVLIKLRLLASYLERMGLDEELEHCYSPHLDALQAKDPDEYLRVVSQFMMSQADATRYATARLSAWAAADEDRWGDVFTAVFGEEDIVNEWLVWIRKIEPGIGNRDVLEAMLAMFHRSSKPGALREIWMKRIWTVVDKEKQKPQQEAYLNRILSLSIQLQDVGNALRAWDMLDEDARQAAQWGTMDMYLTAAGRWKDAAELIRKNREASTSSSPEIHAHLAATFRRAGMEHEAERHDAWVEKLVLGSPLSSIRAGGYYAYAGDFQRADLWYRRAAMEAQVSGPEFVEVLKITADHNLRNRNWQIAASCYEALLHMQVGQQFREGMSADLVKTRMNADLARAMARLPEDREHAVEILRDIHQAFMPDASLADDFFPALRAAGLNKELQTWFSQSWNHFESVIQTYPQSHHSRNSAAWFASRARLKLAEAESYLAEAIRMSPDQAAYLDTMAELKFAQGDRKAALDWSQRSLCRAPFDEMIRLQHERFRTERLPGR